MRSENRVKQLTSHNKLILDSLMIWDIKKLLGFEKKTNHFLGGEIVEAERKETTESLLGKPAGKCSVTAALSKIIAANALVGLTIGIPLKQAADKAKTKLECDDLRPLLVKVLEEMKSKGEFEGSVPSLKSPIKGDFTE